MTNAIETGTVTLSSTIDESATASVSFSTAFDSKPVVLAYVPTRGGGEFLGARVKGVTTTGCTIFIEEPDDQGHNQETAVWMAFERGTYTIDGLSFEVGVHSTSTVRYKDGSTAYDNFDSVSFSQSWSSAPVVLHTLNSYNNGAFMGTSVQNVSTSSFDLAQEALETGHESGATTEDIGYVAVENVGVTTLDGNTVEVGAGSDGSNDGYEDSPHNISFSASFGSTPDVVVSGQTLNGGDGFEARGDGTWSATDHDVFADEDAENDTERGHTDESFGYVAIDPNSTVGSPPDAPSGVSATVDANDQISVSWTDNADSEDNFRVQINRDGNGFQDLSSDENDPTPGANATATTVVPDSDTAYSSQVGVDSSFRFRVRAENSAGGSDWAYSGTVYTDPVPPRDPRVSRPDGSTVELTVTRNSDVSDYYLVEFREDTGSGYGDWKRLDAVSGTEGSYKSGSRADEGETVTLKFDADTTYQYSNSFTTDSRVQFRIRDCVISDNQSEYAQTSDWVYADYGNEGNVYFSDDFGSGDASAWDAATLSSDGDSGVHQGSVSGSDWNDLGIGGPATGSYFLRLDDSDGVVKNLGNLSDESDVLVSLFVASGSNDSASEYAAVEWYDGSSWQELRTFSHEYNKQGWVEVTALVPASWLSADNRLRLGRGVGTGPGDLSAFDRVVVSDVLHEYTSPAEPTNPTTDASVEDELTLDWTRNATFGSAEEFTRVHGSGESFTKRFNDPPWTWTGLSDGEKYEWYPSEVVGQARHGSTDNWWRANGPTVTATTTLPAPTSLSVDSQNGDQFDLSWTDNADSEDGYRIYVSRDGGSTWSQDGSVGAGVTTYTTSDLLDGEQYDLQVRAYTEHVEEASNTVTATTALLDVTGLSFDDSVENQLTASWDDTIDYGEYRVEYRESSASSWTDWTTVDQGTSSVTITGLEDGEEYEIRVRSQTEHVTETWASGTATTLLPVVTNLSTGTPTKTEVSLSWTENADNEDGYRVLRGREYDYGWGPWQTVAELDPNATSYTDDSLSPGNTYKYKIEAHTEDAMADGSETDRVTTPGSATPRVRTGSDGWEVVVEHESGRRIRLQILDEPTFRPTLNDHPRVEIPVPRDEKWQESGFEEAAMSVWKDSEVLPIDTLVDVTLEDDRALLEGRGGSELAQRVQAEYDDTEAHIAARNLVRNNTSYGTNVDDPASSTQSNTLVQSGDANTELRSNLNGASPTTAPFEVSGGSVSPVQTCWVWEAESDFWTEANANPAYSGDPDGNTGNSTGLGQFANPGDDITYSFTCDYDIPAENFHVAVRDDVLDDGSGDWVFPGFTIYLDGVELLTYADDWGSYDQNVSWDKSAASASNSGISTISAGSHTIRFEANQYGQDKHDTWVLDVVAAYDDRFDYTWDNDNGNPYTFTDVSSYDPAYLSGPELYPDAVDVEFEDATTAFKVVGGKVELTIDDTSGKQAVALSNDQGSNYESASNAAAFETSFTGTSTDLRTKVTLSRYGTRSGATPTTGINGQSVDSYSLYADLEDTPILDGQQYDGALVDVLGQIADYGNFVWELRRDQQGGWTVEWTQPGQRTADASAGIADYSVSKSVEKAYEKVVVKGAAQPVRGEEFSAALDGWVVLDRAHLVPATEIVRDPSDGTTYELGTDYELDRGEGKVKALSGGSMSDGTTYEIDYRYKTQGSYTSNDAGSDPDALVETIPSVTSDRGCEQAALYLVQRIQDPVWNATVTLPRTTGNRSLVDDLGLDDLPTNGTRMEIRDLRQTPSSVTLELGSRRSIGEIVSDLQSRVDSVSERV